VIIPTYNRDQSVTLAIDSVLAQTFTDYEIIVVDDGSTDNTKGVLDPYIAKIQYIYKENKGVSAARNTGIRAAKGEWIAFLDSDDEWLPCKLEFQIKDIQQFPEAVLSCSNILFEGLHETTPIDFFKTCLTLDINHTQFIREPLFKGYAWTSTVLAKRDTIMIAGMFDEELSIHEDTDLFLRLSTFGGFTVNPSILAKAFRRNEFEAINLSDQFLRDKEKNFKSLIKIYKKILNYQLTVQQRSFIQGKLSSSWFDLGLVYQNLKKFNQAKRCFLLSFQVDPTWKNFVKFFLGLSGPIGVNYIEKRRETKKGFRRSEYYQNDSKQ